MNWQVSQLDNIGLISNSDAHSLRKLGREANVFEIAQLSYDEIIRVIREHKPEDFLYTIEFFPEEGKYHLDGHRDHSFSCLPEETKKYGGICPNCGKKLLRGVLSRVDDLGDRAYGFMSPRAVPFKSIIPLEEIIAETLGLGTGGKKVLEQYENMVGQMPEFEILLDATAEQITGISTPTITESVMRVRDGKVHIAPGYDGVFGKINIYTTEEREAMSLKPKQASLF